MSNRPDEHAERDQLPALRTAQGAIGLPRNTQIVCSGPTDLSAKPPATSPYPPPTTRPPEGLTPEQQAKRLYDQQWAENLAAVLPAFYLCGSADPAVAAAMTPGATATYLAKLVEKCDAAGHPIQQMFVERIAWVHHAVGQLLMKANEARGAKQQGLYLTTASRFMGEFRKLALALHEFGSPPAPKLTTMVGQQNLVAGDQQIAILADKSGLKPALPIVVNNFAWASIAGRPTGFVSRLGKTGTSTVQRQRLRSASILTVPPKVREQASRVSPCCSFVLGI